MKVRVRNLLGLRTADLTVPEERGIALVAGLNGAGKSSLIEAIRCAALGTAAARGVSTKKAAPALLHNGAEHGSVTLDWGTGSVRVSWPEAEVTTKGQPLEIGSGLAIGARPWMSLPLTERQREFAARCDDAQPTEADIAAFLREQDADPGLAPQLWERVERDGWDATHAAAKEGATKLRGAWERTTGTKWGEQKAKAWRPDGLDPDETYLPEEIEALVVQRRAELDALIARGAVAEAEVERLRPIARELPHRKADEAKAREDQRRTDAVAEALMARKPPDPGMERHWQCPHCKGALRITRNANSALILAVPDRPGLTDEERVKALAAHATWQAELDEAAAASRLAAQVVARCVAAVKEAEAARDRLAEIKEAAGGATPEAIQAARDALAWAEETRGKVGRMIEARGIYNEWAACQPLIAALAPDGVRKAAAARALEGLNAELKALSSAGGWAPVALTPEMDLTLGGRPYPLLSESEQWRADATLTLALAKREGAALVTLDRLDVLERSCRPGALRAVLAAGLPAVIAMTAPDKLAFSADGKGSLPKLRAAEVGTVWWVQDGVLEELPW